MSILVYNRGTFQGNVPWRAKDKKEIVTEMPVPMCMQKREETKDLMLSDGDLMEKN